MIAEKIKVYGTGWRCPDTARARQCLTGMVSHYLVDIEQDKTRFDFVEQVNKGKRRIPTIVFPDGSILVEPSNTELEKKLAE